MNSRLKNLSGGILLITLAVGALFWNWYLIIDQGRYYRGMAMLGPATIIIGLGYLVFGDYRTERARRGEDTSELSGLKLLTTKWWGILVVALAAGLAHLIYIEFFYQS